MRFVFENGANTHILAKHVDQSACVEHCFSIVVLG